MSWSRPLFCQICFEGPPKFWIESFGGLVENILASMLHVLTVLGPPVRLQASTSGLEYSHLRHATSPEKCRPQWLSLLFRSRSFVGEKTVAISNARLPGQALRILLLPTVVSPILI